MSALHDFHFLRPWWLLALVVLPLLPLLLRRQGGMAALHRLVDASLLPFLVEGSGRRRLGFFAGFMLAWALASLALAGPAWQRVPQPVFAARSAQVVVVSLSQRMLAADVKPDRMTRVRYKIRALFHANKAGQNALVAYAGAAFTVAPLTSDADALTDLLDALGPDTMPVQGNDAAAGIRRATKLLLGAGEHAGSIVLIDDHADADALAAARTARARGMRVSVLGVGTTKGAPVPRSKGGFVHVGGHVLMAKRDDASLRAVARAGGGRYLPMQADGSDVDAMKTQLPAARQMRESKRHVDAWRDEGPWLLLLLLPLAALAFRRGALLLLPLLMLAPLLSAPAHAGGWQDAWRTRDQQAARALAAGHPKQALQLAHDPALRGTAAYRAGDYKAAAHYFAQASGARNLYNRGNALAKMHRYQDALKAYQRALDADPELADARTNRKAILDWLKHQRKSKPKHGDKHGSSDSDRKSQGRPASGDSSKSPTKGQGGQHKPGTGSTNTSPQSSPASHGTGDRHKPGTQAKPSPSEASPKAPSASEQAAQKRARQALKKRMDQALDKSSGQNDKPYALGAQPAANPGHGKKLPAAMRQALQRVPDDPGGLLRRKFMLEYQRRQQRGQDGSSTHPEQSE